MAEVPRFARNPFGRLDHHALRVTRTPFGLARYARVALLSKLRRSFGFEQVAPYGRARTRYPDRESEGPPRRSSPDRVLRCLGRGEQSHSRRNSMALFGPV